MIRSFLNRLSEKVRAKEKGSATVDFVASFLFISIFFLALIFFVLSSGKYEVEYYYDFVNARTIKAYKSIFEPYHKSCEDNPVFMIGGGEAC